MSGGMSAWHKADIPEPPINVRYGGKADDAIAPKRAVPRLKNDPFQYASLSQYDALS